MPHRNDLDAAHARIAALERELADTKRQMAEQTQLAVVASEKTPMHTGISVYSQDTDVALEDIDFAVLKQSLDEELGAGQVFTRDGRRVWRGRIDGDVVEVTVSLGERGAVLEGSVAAQRGGWTIMGFITMMVLMVITGSSGSFLPSTAVLTSMLPLVIGGIVDRVRYAGAKDKARHRLERAFSRASRKLLPPAPQS